MRALDTALRYGLAKWVTRVGGPRRVGAHVTRWKPCLAPGCPELVESGRCPEHTPERRPTPRPPRQRLAFDNAAWQKLSLRIRKQRPWCECRDPDCMCGGTCSRPSTEVDHIIPRRMFATAGAAHREENLQALCNPCHRSRTRRTGL
jgi:5-methylcytosine-specific restriction endonuclease McrA